jgi:hypothetical protein
VLERSWRIFSISFLCYAACVKPLSTIGRLLSMLAIVGLAIAPVARPAMGMAAVLQPDIASDHGIDHAATDAAMAMPEDMPCCPKKAPVPNCDKDCLAICATQLLCNAAQVPGPMVPLGLSHILLPLNDTGLVGLKQRPPPRPPKI